MDGDTARRGALQRITSMHNMVQSSLEDGQDENLRLLSQ
jgi:hypothetical protein